MVNILPAIENQEILDDFLEMFVWALRERLIDFFLIIFFKLKIIKLFY